MGIFSRFRDIINSNINSMLDKAEDPEKLIRLMIQEMEDTLVEIKASCAGAMASRARVARALEEATRRANRWGSKAEMAIEKGRDDLAREALLEKKALQEQIDSLQRESDELSSLIDRYQGDIQQLEEKLATTRNKHRVLIQRHVHAQKKKKAQTNIRQVTTTDAFARFEQFETRIDRMEADAELINPPQKGTLEDEFKKLETDEQVEKELAELKRKVQQSKPAA